MIDRRDVALHELHKPETYGLSFKNHKITKDTSFCQCTIVLLILNVMFILVDAWLCI